MRKLIAISLLSLHLFSLTVCFVAHFIAVYHSDRFFEKQISRGLYNKKDITEVRIPVNMPGITDWKGYEDMYGEVRFANTAYNYIKIRMTHNAIYLLCIPNYKTTRLCGKNIIDASKLPDIPVKSKDHVPFDKIFHLSAFNTYGIHYRFLVPVKPVYSLSCMINTEVINSAITSPGQPPERA